ncbi:MAG: Ig-like domain-containing protein [Sulfuricellaceae bacterium]
MKRLFLLISVLACLMAAQVFAAACTDADISGSLNQGMATAQTQLKCGLANSSDVNAPFIGNRSSLLSDTASFSSLDNTLRLPKVSVAGAGVYTNVRALLPPGGVWSLLGANYEGAASAAGSSTPIYNASSLTLRIPAVSVDGVGYTNVWLYLPSTQPWSVLGVGTPIQPPLPATGNPTTTPTVTATGKPTLTLTLTDPGSGQTRNSISSSSPARLTAVVRDANGAAVPGVIVTFATDTVYGSLTPASGTALSDANGTATATLNADSTAGGASTVTASAKVGSVTVTGSLNYAVGSGTPTATPTIVLTLTDPNSGQIRNSISSSSPARLTAIVKDANGAVVPGVVVTFATDSIYGALTPASGTVLSDTNGAATATLNANSTAGGASTVTASVQVAGATVTGSLNYAVNAGTSTSAPTLTLTLTDPSTGQTRNSISSGSPALLTATVRDASGATVSGVVVTFATDIAYGSLTPASGTALSDVNGAAKVTLNADSAASGASIVTATAQVAGVTVAGSLNYSIGTTNITLGPLTFLPVSPLAAYGTTSVNVTVLSNGVAQTTPTLVTFTSACAGSGKAVLTPAVTTVNGVATASYRDNGCNNTDTVTATLASGASATQNLVVTAPGAGSIRFVSVSPSTIALKGTGGAGRQESATVTFRVVDNSGNPIGGKTISFTLSTTLGGLTLSSSSAVSDPVTGDVVTNVNAGTISTSVRVTASDGVLSTQSDQLAVATGLPAQDSFSLSALVHNIEGWAFDGEKTTLTARLADHFHNPVSDGTAVYFTSEGGSIAPSCVTLGGACSVDFTSQALRPTNGRVTILARAIGEEAFIDLNSNGVVDDATEMIDANGASTDIGEAYVDYDEDGTRDATEPYFDFNGDGAYSVADGKYSGSLCSPSAVAGFCSTQKSIDVRGKTIIVLSTSRADITINGGGAIALPVCTAGMGGGVGAPATFTVTVVDTHGNALPVDTKIDFATTNGTILSETSHTFTDSIGCRTVGYAGCPAAVGSATFGDYYVTMQGDATWDTTTGACTNAASSGTFSVTVTTPKNEVTTASVNVTD